MGREACDKESIKAKELRKTGRIVDIEGVMPNYDNPDEKMYVFGLEVGEDVYRCHYITKEDIKMSVGDYASINARLYEIPLGFTALGIVRVLCMGVLTKEQIRNLDKDHAFIADFKVRGQDLPLNVQNGFMLNLNKKTKVSHYGIFYGFDEDRKSIGFYDNLTSLYVACIKTADEYDQSEYENIEIVDFFRMKNLPFAKFMQNISRRRG